MTITECRTCAGWEIWKTRDRELIRRCSTPEAPLTGMLTAATDTCSCHTDRPDPFEPQEIDEP